jgi:glutamate synthase (NADPH/NADH) small chain
MADPKGFLKVERKEHHERPVQERIGDWRELIVEPSAEALRAQASRCMDCGIPFCHQGCPLGNLIPEWNDLVWQQREDEAVERLYETNNFPEVTGRVCPAPCEASCVLNIREEAVTIKDVERTIAARALANGLKPRPAARALRTRVAVVGSGPAGLAAAQQLARKGHRVVVFERDDRVGGLLRYGIPDFKMEKNVLDLRLEQMRAEGVEFRTSVDPAADPRTLREFDAVVLAIGARAPRDLEVPGRQLRGVHFAMEFLTQQNKRVAGDRVPDAEAILATGKHVVVIGGGDTGSDCVGTSIRQGAASVTQLELMPKPPLVRLPTNPWPAWPLIFRTSSSQEEGCARDFAVMTKSLEGQDGRVRALRAVRVEMKGGKLEELPDSSLELRAELVLLAMGFVGPQRPGLVEQLGLTLDARGNVVTDAAGRTNVERVFCAGDASRGQSLVVWAIADGRRVAEGVHAFLTQRSRKGTLARVADMRSS